MAEPIETNVRYVGGPMDGQVCRLLYCDNESVFTPEGTYYYRLVRVEGSGVATLVYAGVVSQPPEESLT